MEARPRKRTARERMAYMRGKMRSRGERATATEVSSRDVEAATTKAAMEATATAVEATAAAVKATAAAKATTASGICRDRQNHRTSQHSSTCGEFRPEFQHGCRPPLTQPRCPPRLPTGAGYVNPTTDKLFQLRCPGGKSPAHRACVFVRFISDSDRGAKAPD